MNTKAANAADEYLRQWLGAIVGIAAIVQINYLIAVREDWHAFILAVYLSALMIVFRYPDEFNQFFYSRMKSKCKCGRVTTQATLNDWGHCEMCENNDLCEIE